MTSLSVFATAVLAEGEGFDPNTVTPGVVGFAITFLIALATVLLLVDMTRRVRRTRYRAEVREQIERERADRAAGIEPTQPADDAPRD